MPDLTTMGKAIANGFPLAAIGGRRVHMERFNTNPQGDVHFGGTFNGNAVAVEAGLATIEQLEDGSVHEHVFALGERMRRGLAEVAQRVAVPAVVGGFGSLFVLCFMDGPLTPTTTSCATTPSCSAATGASWWRAGSSRCQRASAAATSAPRTPRTTSTARSRPPRRRCAPRSTRARGALAVRTG